VVCLAELDEVFTAAMLRPEEEVSPGIQVGTPKSSHTSGPQILVFQIQSLEIRVILGDILGGARGRGGGVKNGGRVVSWGYNCTVDHRQFLSRRLCRLCFTLRMKHLQNQFVRCYVTTVVSAVEGKIT
jgi:hypothetical protein